MGPNLLNGHQAVWLSDAPGDIMCQLPLDDNVSVANKKPAIATAADAKKKKVIARPGARKDILVDGVHQ